MLTASITLSITLLFAVTSLAVPAPKSIWDISIFRDPAPSPEDGPPAAANALRDKGKLKFEVVGIICAYLAWIFATVVLLLIVKRRFKKNHQKQQRHSHVMEALKSGRVTLREIEAGPKSPLGPLSPKSPGKMSTIRSWAKGNKGRTSESSLPSTVTSRVDERVVEHDRAKNMDEMANLYAAVMIHDQTRGPKSQSSADSSPVLDDYTPASPRSPRTPRTPRSPQYPPEYAHPAYVPPVPQAYSQNYPQSYPQEYLQSTYEPMQPPPIPETDEDSLLEGQTPRKPKKSLSIVSSAASRLGSSGSGKAKPAPITVRGQPISRPLGSADLTRSAYSPQASLPSIYSPGPPPPTPGRQAKVEEIEMHGVPQITQITQGSGNNSSKALPFRQFYQQDSLKSAPATKTTFLDRRTSAFNGPKTGVPKTPYSPYCPSTPMTPITPRRLLNKEELKKNKKQYAMEVVQENSMVKNEDDMWGTA